MKKVIIAISYSLVLLFLYAATSKLLTYDKFVVQIGQSEMLSPYAGVLAWLVPLIEIVIAVLLVFSGLRLLGLYASLGLMAMFTAYIFIVLHFMEKQPCGCGGVLQAMTWSQHLVFNSVFTVLVGVGIVLHQVVARPEPDGGLPRGSG